MTNSPTVLEQQAQPHHDQPRLSAKRLTVLMIVTLYGFGPSVQKLISAPPVVTAAARNWMATPIIWLTVYARGGRVDRAMLRKTVVPGAFLGLNAVVLLTALQHASVAVITMVQALQPALVLVVAGRYLGERWTRWHATWTAIGVGGVIVVVLAGRGSVSGDGLGVVLSFGSLFTYCGFYLLNRHVRSTTAIEPMQFMAGCTLFAALAVTPFALVGSNRGDFDQLGGSDWWYLLFAAVGLSTIAHGSMSWLHKYVVAARSSLIILASNVVAIAAAWWIHDEPITIAQAVGSAVVLGAVAAVVSRGPVPDPEPAL